MITCVGYLNYNSNIPFIDTLPKDDTVVLQFQGPDELLDYSSINLEDSDRNNVLSIIKEMYNNKNMPSYLVVLNFQELENETNYEKTSKNAIYNALIALSYKSDCNLFFIIRSLTNFGLMEAPELELLNKHSDCFIYYDDANIGYSKTFDIYGKPCYNII